MVMVVSIVPNECAWLLMCFAKFEESLLSLAALLCSLNLVENFLPVCPMYALLQSGHVSLYTPECVCWSSLVWLWFVKRFLVVLFVRNDIFMLVFLKMLVMYVVSFPM